MPYLIDTLKSKGSSTTSHSTKDYHYIQAQNEVFFNFFQKLTIPPMCFSNFSSKALIMQSSYLFEVNTVKSKVSSSISHSTRHHVFIQAS